MDEPHSAPLGGVRPRQGRGRITAMSPRTGAAMHADEQTGGLMVNVKRALSTDAHTTLKAAHITPRVYERLAASAWDRDATAALVDAVAAHGRAWGKVAAALGGKHSAEGCEARFEAVEKTLREERADDDGEVIDPEKAFLQEDVVEEEEEEEDEEDEEEEEKKQPDFSQLVPRGMTERQQLAFLLQQARDSTAGHAEEDEEEDEEAPKKKKKKNKAKASKPAAQKAPSAPTRTPRREDEEEEEEEEYEQHDDSDDSDESYAPRKHSHTARKKRSRMMAKALKLASGGERLADKFRPADYNDWSEAKKAAWEAIEVNPNAFYYRHLPPGEVQRSGKWAQDERDIFMRVLKEHPPTNGHWGLFAMHVPGRVGYQCRNFYHSLLNQGILKDPDYMNEKGEYTVKKVRRSTSAPRKPSRRSGITPADYEAAYEILASSTRRSTRARKAKAAVKQQQSSDEAPKRKAKASPEAQPESKRARVESTLALDDASVPVMMQDDVEVEETVMAAAPSEGTPTPAPSPAMAPKRVAAAVERTVEAEVAAVESTGVPAPEDTEAAEEVEKVEDAEDAVPAQVQPEAQPEAQPEPQRVVLDTAPHAEEEDGEFVPVQVEDVGEEYDEDYDEPEAQPAAQQWTRLRFLGTDGRAMIKELWEAYDAIVGATQPVAVPAVQPHAYDTAGDMYKAHCVQVVDMRESFAYETNRLRMVFQESWQRELHQLSMASGSEASFDRACSELKARLNPPPVGGVDGEAHPLSNTVTQHVIAQRLELLLAQFAAMREELRVRQSTEATTQLSFHAWEREHVQAA